MAVSVDILLRGDPFIVVLRDLCGGDGVSEAVAFVTAVCLFWCWLAVYWLDDLAVYSCYFSLGQFL